MTNENTRPLIEVPEEHLDTVYDLIGHLGRADAPVRPQIQQQAAAPAAKQQGDAPQRPHSIDYLHGDGSYGRRLPGEQTPRVKVKAPAPKGPNG